MTSKIRLPDPWRAPLLVAGTAGAMTAVVAWLVGRAVSDCDAAEDDPWGCVGEVISAFLVGVAGLFVASFVVMRLFRVPRWGLAGPAAFWLAVQSLLPAGAPMLARPAQAGLGPVLPSPPDTVLLLLLPVAYAAVACGVVALLFRAGREGRLAAGAVVAATVVVQLAVYL